VARYDLDGAPLGTLPFGWYSAPLGAHPDSAAMLAAMDDLDAHGSAWADDG